MDHDRRALARSSGGIASLAALGVFSGFLVDAAMAALFGASARTDAFFIAATIPFAIAAVLLASTNQALVPLINNWFRDGSMEEATRRVEGLLGTSLVGALGLSAIGVAASAVIPDLLAPGSSSQAKGAATAMTALLFVTVVTRVGSEVLRALLNARFSFLAPAAMPVVENATVLVVTLSLAGRYGVRAVALGYVAGGVTQLAYMIAMTARSGIRPRPRVAFGDREVRRAFRLLRLPLAGTGLNLLARAIERFLASFLAPGSITILNYAWVVVNSIGGAIFFRSVVVALLPRLAEAVGDRGTTRRILRDGLRLMALISFPLTALVAVLAGPLVSFAFQRGAFTGAAATLLASVLTVYALQFPLDAAVRVLLSASYARLDTRTPFVNMAIGVSLDIAFALALFRWLGIRGIAIAYVLASIGNLAHAHRRVAVPMSLPLRSLGMILAKLGASSVVAGIVAAAVLALVPDGSSFVARLLRLGVPGMSGLVAFVLSIVVAGFRPSALRTPPAVEERDHGD